MRIVDFRIPLRTEEAQRVLAELGPRGLPLAGGTSVEFVPGKDERVAVDITRLGLGGIRAESANFCVGATTRIAELQDYHAPGWVLDGVAPHLASQQIRNMSTLGGNIARVFPWADFPVALLALDAQMVIGGGADRVLPADGFFEAQPARLFAPGELLKEVRITALGPGEGFAYRKEKRTAAGFSLATVAVRLALQGRHIGSARIAAGSCIPFPRRLVTAERALAGCRPREAEVGEAVSAGLAGVKFMENAGLSETYVEHLTRVLLRDAILEAAQRARAGGTEETP
jgi:CO/xanthine dehydrogenase FAD-binding subunit